jgi:polysaccharide biosynthesis/export protein
MMAPVETSSRAFALVEVDNSVIAVLSQDTAPSLKGTFGDYRPSQEQVIGVGDAVQITIWEAGPGGLFSAPVVDRYSPGSRSASIPEQVVGRDGAITVPFAGLVPVTGRTPHDIERMIMARLADKAIDPQVLLSVTHNISNTVTVMGESSGGARVPLTIRGDRLLDIIATAGGAHTSPHDTAVVLERKGRVAQIPLQAVMENPKENIFLQSGDVITLLRDPQSFTAIGATGRNGVVAFETSGLTLDEALAKAGGLIDERADPAGLFIIRYEVPAIAASVTPADGSSPPQDGAPIVYHLNMRNPGALFLARRFPMRKKDILYVSNSPYTSVQKVLNLVNLLTSPVIGGATINNAVK